MSLQHNSLFMSMELSKNYWLICFASDGARHRQVTVSSGHVKELLRHISLAKEKFGLKEDAPVYSCFEAGRDGFWIHRMLEEYGIENVVIDPASIEVSRHARIRKTDRLDAKRLLDLLLRDKYYNMPAPYSVVCVPTLKDEDNMRLNRERERLVKERTGHRARIRSILTLHGRNSIKPQMLLKAPDITAWNGEELPPCTRAELQREVKRLELVEEHIKEVEIQQKKDIEESEEACDVAARKLMQLKSVGPQSAMLLGREIFGWRKFRNRKALGSFVGMTGTPYDSGETLREQGISKAGSGRIRTALIELAWGWLRYQPESELSIWFYERFAFGGARARKKGIVALGRKLIIALWKYLENDELPAGAKLKV